MPRDRDYFGLRDRIDSMTRSDIGDSSPSWSERHERADHDRIRDRAVRAIRPSRTPKPSPKQNMRELSQRDLERFTLSPESRSSAEAWRNASPSQKQSTPYIRHSNVDESLLRDRKGLAGSAFRARSPGYSNLDRHEGEAFNDWWRRIAPHYGYFKDYTKVSPSGKRRRLTNLLGDNIGSADIDDIMQNKEVHNVLRDSSIARMKEKEKAWNRDTLDYIQKYGDKFLDSGSFSGSDKAHYLWERVVKADDKAAMNEASFAEKYNAGVPAATDLRPPPTVDHDQEYKNQLRSWAQDQIEGARLDRQQFADRGGQFMFPLQAAAPQQAPERYDPNLMLQMMMQRTMGQFYPQNYGMVGLRNDMNAWGRRRRMR